MGLYQQHIFPRLLNWAMSGQAFRRIRAELLAPVQGRVLEIGVGTGLNLPHYSGRVERLTLLDSNPAMRERVDKQLVQQGLKGDFLTGSAEKLSLDSDQFDAVVCTWVLCSVAQPERVLNEIARVLKPQGKLYLVEHGLSPNPRIQKWQTRLSPLQACLGDGCRLDRDIKSLLQRSRLEWCEYRNYYAPGGPRVASYFYQGVAQSKAP